MAPLARIHLQGVAETKMVFEQLGHRAQKKVLPKAVRAGGAPILKAMRRGVPKRNRMLSSSLTQVVRRYPSGVVMAVIGQLKNKSRSNKKRIKHTGGISGRGDVVPIHLVEDPTQPHEIRRRGGVLAFRVGGKLVFRRRVSHPGTKGAGFARRAARQGIRPGLQAFETKFRDETLKEAAAVARR